MTGGIASCMDGWAGANQKQKENINSILSFMHCVLRV